MKANAGFIAGLTLGALLTSAAMFTLSPAGAQPATTPAPAPVPAPAPAQIQAAGSCSKPVYMVVQGRSTDRARMIEYGRKLRDLGLYARFGGGYVASGRPIDIFEGIYPDDQTIIIARFPCHARAREFWYSEAYQRGALPLRAGAGQFTIAVYEEQVTR